MKKIFLAACALTALTACSKNGGHVASSRDLVTKSINQAGDKVHFAFDKSDLSKESQDILNKQSEVMQRFENATYAIEGHTDQRGTSEYNFALGERRANAAKEHLVARGISGRKLKVISYGKEKLADTNHTEEAYAQNRRAVTIVE